MGFLIGTDEAGYGPNLGPLVVSATVWQVDDNALDRDLYQSLAPLVVAETTNQPLAIAIADSKRLYKPGGTLAGLERGVLSALSLTCGRPRHWDSLWQALCPDVKNERQQLPWYRNFDCRVPVDTAGDVIEELSQHLHEQLVQSGVRLHAMRSAVLFPAPFNRLVDQFDSKGTVLSTATLDLIADLASGLPPDPLRIVCDKHGGRNHYAGLLQPRFAKGLIRVIKEGREESAYDIGSAERPMDIRFRVGGEAFLPSALASMASKYLREMAMRAFNRFWCHRVQDLKPTAGYPLDARRFKHQISAAQAELGIRDSVLWRQR